MKGQIPKKVKQDRLDRLMTTQQQIAFDYAQSMVGRSVSCLLMRRLEQEEVREMELDTQKNWFLARHKAQAPEIDSECYLLATAEVKIDDEAIVPAMINEKRNYDLIGQIGVKK